MGGGGGGGGGGDAKMGRSLAVKKAGVLPTPSLRTRSLGRRARSADGEEGGIVVAASGSACEAVEVVAVDDVVSVVKVVVDIVAVVVVLVVVVVVVDRDGMTAFSSSFCSIGAASISLPAQSRCPASTRSRMISSAASSTARTMPSPL